MNGEQYFGKKKELVCEADAVLSACITKWVGGEREGGAGGGVGIREDGVEKEEEKEEGE